MNKDIKEILDLMKFANDDIMWCDTLTLNVKQCHLLLDYITKLQEKYNDLLEVHKIENSDIQELQDRIDNAIEYINKNDDYFVNYPLVNREDLLNILKGG